MLLHSLSASQNNSCVLLKQYNEVLWLADLRASYVDLIVIAQGASLIEMLHVSLKLIYIKETYIMQL